MSDRLGTTLQGERYQLQGVLGTGGMATVYRAWDAMLAVDRAVKVLHPQAGASKAIQDRFLDEARTMARLRHPNLVTVHDLGADQGQVFMVMELLPGGSISQRVLDRGPMSPHDAADMLGQALDALQVAHDAGVVHRDIKPQNLLLDEQGRVKLTDFGIARAEGNSAGHTRTGVMLGTWSYMSPEQRDDPRRTGPPADIYAMGATLYAMVTGKRPVDLYVTAAREERIAHLPAPLADVLRKACAYRAQDRYPSARDMAAALRAAQAELPRAPVLGRVALSADASVENTLPTLAGEEDSLPPPAHDPESLRSDSADDTWAGEERSARVPVSPPPPVERRTLDPRTLDASQVTEPAPPAPAGPSPALLAAVVGLVLVVAGVAAYLGLRGAETPVGSPAEATAAPRATAPVVLPVPVAVPVGGGPTGPGGIPGQGGGAVPIPGEDVAPHEGGPPDPAGGPPPPP